MCQVEDNHLFGEDSEIAEGATEKMITGLGILIGFSWEQSFDTAVDVVAEGLRHDCPPTISKMLMTLGRLSRKAVLKEYAKQHFDLFLHGQTDESDLDRAHLLMKRHRRAAHGIKHPGSHMPQLKHLMVTSSGIVEVDAPEELPVVDVLADLSSVEGVNSVQRVVCGGCLDFKVVTKLTAAGFGEWEKAKFAPEAKFLAKLKGIKGIQAVETQTYTLEEVKMNKKDIKKAQEKKDDRDGVRALKTEAPKAEEKPAEDPAKKLKKVLKEGGKRGVEIEGAADMGGLQFFCTSVDEPEGDVDLLKKCVEAMNAKSDPNEEERKGGSGHIGKMVFSAGAEQLAVLAYVPEEKQPELVCEEWLEKVLSTQPGHKILSKAKAGHWRERGAAGI
eukprot:g27163.t1